MKVLVAHPGTQHAPRLARELAQRDLLGKFRTGVAFAEGGPAAAFARACARWPAVGGLATRIVTGIPPARLGTMPLGEVMALLRMQAGQEPHRTLHHRNQVFQERIPDRELRENDAVIAFDTSAWILADRARRANRPLFLDRTIAHPAAYARIMTKFNREYPDWAEPVESRPAEVAAAEASEHDLAHRIVVGGSFARDTLVEEGIAAEKIRVNPYGVDWSRFAAPPVSSAAARPFRFLFVGAVLARKGIPVLFEAWRRWAPKDAELWIAGSIGPRERRLIPDLPGLRILGQVQREDVPALYAQADVFVLPSLFEGFGLVLLEALASGLPVISTGHTGAVELLRDASLGEMVAAGSVDELAAALQRWQAAPGAHRAKVMAVRQRLEVEFSWNAYGDRWVRLLEEKG